MVQNTSPLSPVRATVRRGRKPVRVWFFFSLATGLLGLALVLALVMLGGRWIGRAAQAGAPKNPSQPRPIEPRKGLPVFPGAEGFGTDTPAGRGGKLIEVTSLEDEGPGTLRAALNDPSRRIIVFRVGGIIELREELQILQPFVTVAGQTAPGGGICIKNAGIMIGTHDVLLQHLRVRPGNEGHVNPANNDAVSILGRHSNIGGAHHVVLDHISASWGEDETISTWYGARDITICWSVISEALNRSRHRKGTHSAGLLIGDSSEHVSVHHCLLAHNDFRNPLISMGGTHDIVNNVIYDWGAIPAEVFDIDSNSFLNFVGNVFRPGPSTREGPYEITINPGQRGIPKIYVEGNLGPHRASATADDWAIVCRGWGREGIAPQQYRATEAFTVAPVTKMPAAEALSKVLAEAGATRPARDTVDQRIVSEVQNKTGEIIDSPLDVGGYPKLAPGIAPADADHDGMPDEWERQHGLDPRDASDANKDRDGDGYTNIEEYLHSLSENRGGSPGSRSSGGRVSGK
jgi:pectate lyase